KYLAETNALSNALYLRDPDNGKVIHALRIPGTDSRTDRKNLAFSPDGSRLAVSMQSQKGVHVWNIPARPVLGELQLFRSIPTGRSTGYRVTFTADNQHQVIVTSFAGDAGYYDLGSKAVALSGPDNIRKPASQWVGDREPVMGVAPSAHNGTAW